MSVILGTWTPAPGGQGPLLLQSQEFPGPRTGPGTLQLPRHTCRMNDEMDERKDINERNRSQVLLHRTDSPSQLHLCLTNQLRPSLLPILEQIT